MSETGSYLRDVSFRLQPDARYAKLTHDRITAYNSHTESRSRLRALIHREAEDRLLNQMAGVNPYIAKIPAVKAGRPFRVTFVDEETGKQVEVPVDPATFEFGHIGQDGSVLDIATEAGVDINHSCGGVCACSTCHIYVQKGGESCSRATEDEEDELDKAPALTPESRLSCQCVPDGTKDLVVLIPKWNRNQVKEGHH